MADKYTFHQNLLEMIPSVAAESVVSRSLFKNESMDVTLFGFAKGQALTEHTSPYTAVIEVLKGDLLLTLGGEKVKAGPGSWTLMPPDLPHALYAETEVIMLLTMVRK